ncbi:hypothetical protein AWENTII_009330 [Aspergillus wentii]
MLVRHLDLSEWVAREEDRAAAAQVYDDNIALQLFDPVRMQLSIGVNNQWLNALRARNRDAWISVLLPKMLNLQTLYLDYSHSPVWTQLVFKRAGCGFRPFDTLPRFRFLSDVRLSANKAWGNWGVSLSCGIPFFKLPNVQRIAATKVVSWEMNPASTWHYAFPTPQHTSTVKEISIDRIDSCDELERWTNACQGLKTFHFGAWDDTSSANQTFDPVSLRAMLYASEPTLEDLTVTFNSLDSELPDHPDHQVPALNAWMRSLKRFRMLKHLHMRFPNLIDVSGRNNQDITDPDLLHTLANDLPESLETLVITDNYPEHFESLLRELTRLLQSKSKFPSLSRISLCMLARGLPDDNLPADLVRRSLVPLTALGQSVGVEVLSTVHTEP